MNETPDFIQFVIDLYAGKHAPLCAFCRQKPATHTTSADDAVCEKCYQEFEDALEGDSDE